MQSQEAGPSWQEVAFVVAVTAGVSYGVVQTVKTFMRDWAIKKGFHHHPWWWRGTLRVLAIATGASCGWLVWQNMPDCLDCEGWPWGVLVGGGSGASCAAIVAALKTRLSGKPTAESTLFDPSSTTPDQSDYQPDDRDV